MKKIIAASVLAMGMMTTAATADVNVGVGYGAGENSIRVPIDFDNGFRIEPDIGFGTDTYTVGVGGYYTIAEVSKINLFAGGKIDYTSFTFGNFNTSRMDFAGVVGAEYFVVENKMSIAAEVGLGLYGGITYEHETSDSAFGTTGTIIGRYFF